MHFGTNIDARLRNVLRIATIVSFDLETQTSEIRLIRGQVAGNETDTELLPITESSRIPLEKALDEAFTISGLHH